MVLGGRSRSLFTGTCGALVLSAALASAQPPSPTSYGLKPEANPEIATGKIAIVRGEAASEPVRFAIENLTILQPVELLVVTERPDDDVKVQISKVIWDQVEREASTKGAGAADFKFRSEGDVKIKVTAPSGPRAFQLVLWTGDAVPPPMRSPFVSMAVYRQRHPDGGSNSAPAMWIIAGALVVIALLLGVTVLRRKAPPASIALVLAVSLGGAVLLAGPPLPVTTTNDVWPTGNAIQTMKENIQKYKDYKDAQDAVGKAGGAAGSVLKTANAAKSASDLLDAYKALSQGDQQADPNYNPPGSPEVPASCEEAGSGSCDCYTDAYARLNKARFNLERLRALRNSTEEFYKASVSFGDDVSGIHGVAGLAWQAERRKIEQSFRTFKDAYTKKDTQLIGEVKGALDQIAVCEAKYYNNPDWYNRFGFIYYNFMEGRYAW